MLDLFSEEEKNSIALKSFQILNHNLFHLDKEGCYKKGSERGLFEYHIHTV